MSEQTLRDICGKFRVKLRAMLVEYGILQLVFVGLTAALILILADWHFRFSQDLRMVALLAVLVCAGLCGYFGLYRPLRRTWKDDDVLGYMDRISAQGGDALMTLRDLAHPETMREYDTAHGKEIVRSVLAELSASIAKVNINSVLRRNPVDLWRKIAGTMVVIFVVGLVMPRDAISHSSYLGIGLKRLLLPYASVFWPQATRLFVQDPPSGWRVPKGEQLIVKARIDGVIPSIVSIVYQSQSSDAWITERMAVNATAKEAMFTFGEMSEPMTFYCIGGDDAEKRKYTVTVAERPVITGIKANYSYPAYMRLPKKATSSGQLAGPEGADVKLDFSASTSLQKVMLTVAYDGEEVSKPLEIKDLRGNNFSHEMRLTKSGSYVVELTDKQNLKNGRVERYEIRVEPDNPPEVVLEEPVTDMLLTGNGKVHVKFKAKDDYNLTELGVMMAPVGDKGRKLSDRITGDFWQAGVSNAPVGEGDFFLDFPREKDKGTLKDFKIDQGAELELWVHAVDCNPTGKGVTESIRVRLSVLTETDFMDAIVLKAKELMNDARVGWMGVAGAYHDGNKWVKQTGDDKLLAELFDQELTAERSADALKLHYQEIVQHMERNRMQKLFMMKRFENVGSLINDVSAMMMEIGKKVAMGQPTSSQEAELEAKRAKMAKVLQAVSLDQKKAAWQMRLLYDRLADWVALQTVLLKTRRIEELQTKLNLSTDQFVKKTLGREARDLEDIETRQMREIGGLQQTVYDMEEAVEKELLQLTVQAGKEGRKKVWEALMTAFRDLRDNRIKDKLKQASMNILDAKGDLVRNDQKKVLEVVSTVNRALIIAGEQVPEEVSAAVFAQELEDPRGKKDENAIETTAGAEIDVDDVKSRERIAILDDSKMGSIEDTLDRIYRMQEDVRNRTLHIADRGKLPPRYAALRIGLTSYRQGMVTNLLNRALAQMKDYGNAKAADAGQPPSGVDPMVEKLRTRANSHLDDCLGGADDAAKLIMEGDFSLLVLGLQTHVQQGSRDVRVFLQQSERTYKLAVDRKATNYKDPFDRTYLLNSNNFVTVADASKELEWGLVLQTSAQRESDLLAKLSDAKNLSPLSKSAIERLEKASRRKVADLVGLVSKTQAGVAAGVSDSSDPERKNENVQPAIQEKLLSQLNVKEYGGMLAQFDQKDYRNLAAKQETLRLSLSSILLSLSDIFEARVPPVIVIDEKDPGGPVDDSGAYIEYLDEQPAVLADRLEKDGEWIDLQTGDPEVRKALVKRLREIGKFDPRYARLQSAYFQALSQDFQAKARKGVDKKKKDDGKK